MHNANCVSLQLSLLYIVAESVSLSAAALPVILLPEFVVQQPVIMFHVEHCRDFFVNVSRGTSCISF